jgi:hypothetical protein
MVTASPIDGFLLATAEALKALAEMFNKFWDWFILYTSLDNILMNFIN